MNLCSQESRSSVVRPGGYFQSRSKGAPLYYLQHHLDFFLLFFCNGKLPMRFCSHVWKGVAHPISQLLTDSWGWFFSQLLQAYAEIRSQGLWSPLERALNPQLFLREAADARAAAQPLPALGNADSEAEALQGASLVFTQSSWAALLGGPFRQVVPSCISTLLKIASLFETLGSLGLDCELHEGRSVLLTLGTRGLARGRSSAITRWMNKWNE